jgi:predicted DNA-binding WGR domain protein
LDRALTWNDNLVMQPTETTPVHLIHVNPEVNMARFYRIDLQLTLFGKMSVLRSWGRIGTQGRGMMVTYEDAAQATEAFLKLDKKKRCRGYVAVSN